MRIIDIHTHLAFHECYSSGFLEGVAETVESEAKAPPGLASKLIQNALGDPDGEKLVQQMNNAGISTSVLLIADYGYALGEPCRSIEEIHELHRNVLAKFPSRFHVFAGIDPRRGPSGVLLFQRSLEEFRFSGLKLYPPCGFELDDDRLKPYYEICHQFKLPLLTHTGPSLKGMRTESKYPDSLRRAAKQFQGISFILGHGGARDCATTIQLASELENVYFDVSGFQNHISTVGDYKRIFAAFLEKVPRRVLFGSDWPMFSIRGNQAKWVDFFISLELMSTQEQAWFFHDNSRAILDRALRVTNRSTN